MHLSCRPAWGARTRAYSLAFSPLLQPDQGRGDDGSRRSPAWGLLRVSMTAIPITAPPHSFPWGSVFITNGLASARRAPKTTCAGVVHHWHRSPSSSPVDAASFLAVPCAPACFCLIDSICSRASPAAGKHQTSCRRARQPRRPPDSQQPLMWPLPGRYPSLPPFESFHRPSTASADRTEKERAGKAWERRRRT